MCTKKLFLESQAVRKNRENVKEKALKLHNFPLPETCLARCQNHIFVSLVNGTLADTNCVNLNKSAYNNLNILPPSIWEYNASHRWRSSQSKVSVII